MAKNEGDVKGSCLDYVLMLCSGLLYTFAFFYRGSFAPIADAIEEELHTTASGFGLMASAFYIGYFSSQIPTGILLEIFSPQFTVIISSIGMGCCCLVIGFVENINIAIGTQVICGLFAGPTYLSTITIIDARLGNNSIPFWNGVMLFITYSFFLGATFLQAQIYDTYNYWRPTYYILSSLFGLLSIIIFIIMIIESITLSNNIENITTHELDTFDDNTPLLKNKQSKNNCCINFGIYKKNRKVNNNKNTNLINELKIKLILSFKNIWNYAIGTHLFCISVIALTFNGLWLILYLMVKFDYSRTTSTIITNSYFISCAVAQLFFGYLSTKYKRRKIFIMIGTMIMCLGCTFIIYCGSETHMIIVIIMNCLSGFGFASMPTAFTLGRELNAFYGCEETALGVINTLTNMSGFIGQFVIGLLIDLNWDNRNGEKDINGDRIYNEYDYNFAFIIIPISLGLACIIDILLRESYGYTVQYTSEANKNYKSKNFLFRIIFNCFYEI